jgi:hypothetical protein
MERRCFAGGKKTACVVRALGEIATKKLLLVTIAIAFVFATAPARAQPRSFSASGTHQCGSPKGGSCVVTGSGFSNCNDASVILQARDCCPTAPARGKSSGFTLNYCIPDRSQ